MLDLRPDGRNWYAKAYSKVRDGRSKGESCHQAAGGAVAQSVERATPGEEVSGSIPAVAARSLLVGSVSV